MTFQRGRRLAVAGVATCAVMAQAGYAQTTIQTPSDAAARTGQAAKTYDFRISAGPLGQALNRWSRKAGRSIVFRSEDVGNKRTYGVRGVMSEWSALDKLLFGTGLQIYQDPDGSVAIVALFGPRETEIGQATPDILVEGVRSWSLNTGIKRSQDDSQPFIVMSREEIQRSGAPNLETFLRDKLNVNSTPGVSEQRAPGNLNDARGTSSINLRGLGTRDTLILVDGRRQPGVNLGDGNITQASITGIPIAAIERIEVLASSASGIYGSAASGGVINIVLKRDFIGGEISSTYSDTTDFAAGQGQVDLTYGMPLESGRTRMSVTASWLKSDPLRFGDRLNIRQRAIDTIRRNDPQLFTSIADVPAGSLPNYRSTSGDPLVLKPEFGGQTLGSSFGYVPQGYPGLAAGGIAPLLAAVGDYDFNPPNSSTALGRRAPLIFGSERFSGSLTLRREFNSWLTAYAGLTFSQVRSETYFNRGPTTVDLSADSPENPFDQSISIKLPGIGSEVKIDNRQRTQTLIGGAVVKLPFDWQAALDMSYSRVRLDGDVEPTGATVANLDRFRTGEINPLRDVAGVNLPIEYDPAPFSSRKTPGRSRVINPSLRIAGPLPLRLPGDKAQLTVNVEYSHERVGSITGGAYSEGTTRVTYVGPATQGIWSAYGEIALPILKPDNDVPLLRELELRLSARLERYRGEGGDPVDCGLIEGVPPATGAFADCPPQGTVFVRDVTGSTRTDPSISFRWSPIKSVALRGSFTTGNLPPRLSNLISQPELPAIVFVRDLQRGGELIGELGALGPSIPIRIGGNADVRPETSRTFTAGAIVTPQFIPGLRFSVDWTRIRKKDIYFDPLILLFAGGDRTDEGLDVFLRANPDRAQRAAPSDGFAAGRITSLDLTTVNLTGLSTDAYDFVLNYSAPVAGGSLDVTGRATYVSSLKVESFPGEPTQDFAGTVPTGFGAVGGANGALRWRGSMAVNWTKGDLMLGWQARYFDKYALNVERTIEPAQGSPFVASQLYHDASIAYSFDFGARLRFGINNVFNKKPPIDTTAAPVYYSQYGDIRLRNFYLTMSKSF